MPVHTAPKRGTKTIRYVTLHYKHRNGAASLRYRNRAEITVLMCEQKPYALGCRVGARATRYPRTNTIMLSKSTCEGTGNNLRNENRTSKLSTAADRATRLFSLCIMSRYFSVSSLYCLLAASSSAAGTLSSSDR